MSMTLREMDRLLGRLLEPDGGLEPIGEWAPRIDVSETRETFVLKAEIPGVNQKDIQVSLQDQVLTVKGEKRKETEEKTEKLHRVERTWGAFARSVMLPTPVDAAKVTATFKDGVLTVTLPKTPAVKGTTIAVKGA